MNRIHKIVSRADTLAAAQKYVYGFFDKSMLIHYDTVKVITKRSLSATDKDFWQEVDTAIAQNKSVLGKYIADLKETGCQSVDDFKSINHGYPSKIFHLIAHLLDGFIGIDSVFYNLPEDSHWLSDKLRNKIIAAPERYWLLYVEGYFISQNKASLIHV